MQDWNEIKAWRMETRQGLLAARQTLSAQAREAFAQVMTRLLTETLVLRADDCVGFYWPIRGEIDLRGAVTALCKQQARAALPEVTGRDDPLRFRPWTLDCALRLGTWDIPIPDTPEIVQPTVLLIPCVAVDQHGYRLGYGGGFYDRTLQRARPRPLSIGISLASAILPTIHPQPHDIALDAVLTEHGWHRPPPAGEQRFRPA
jgi:5-formyltetrahydrofolate cyclo-ligase